ncbi:hypothetical protein ABB02_01403 [Clostridiaceae bacterium JG1575]|nr:hypothetical protein ABB02_01403 [Clostridiaceae bacterium JG1575]
MEMRNVSFSYHGNDLFKDFSLNLPQGRWLAVLGPNGSGKSTLLKLFLGLIQPQKGEVLFLGENLQGMSPRERSQRMAYVPQQFLAPFEFTVQDVVAMGRAPYLKGFQEPSGRDWHLVEDALARAGVLHLKDQPITKISGGEVQRCAVARAFAQDTPWIFLDEPVNHLDVRHQVAILDDLKRATPEKSVVAVMHDLNLARDYADEVLVLSKGTLLAKGAPKDCLTPEVLEPLYQMKFLIARTLEEEKQYLFPKTQAVQSTPHERKQ